MDRNDWNRRYAAADLIWSVAPNATVAAEAGPLVPGAALDLGCGEGRNAIWLASRGWRVTAVDFADVAIDKARQLAAERARPVDHLIEWFAGDVTRHHLPPRSFDLVLICFLHLPFATLGPLVARAARAVRPGGRLLYVGHDRSNVVHGHGGPRDPSIQPDAADLRRPLEREGLTVQRAGVVRRPIAERGHRGAAPAASAAPGPAPVRAALDCVVSAVRARA